ncbi:hypothetical protein [uncultured Rhodoblastus sp.]|uniref:hypothetical protein n=1 Tax=uncultured Rhodoblastus sp. TaxID=543037 RepID=UPI0025CDD5A3|nr:hypothetical protein [uncultured Rhodoblastus sp.]
MKIKSTLLSAALAGSMLVGAAAVSNSARAAGIPGAVSGASFGASTASPLGGRFVYLFSKGVSPFLSPDPWGKSSPNAVYSATFSSPSGANFYFNTNDSGNILYFGLPDTTTFGETFIAPGGNMLDWNFQIYTNPTAGNADFFIATWDGSRAVTPLFYERLSIPAGYSTADSGPFNLALTAGTEYVAFLTVGSVPETSTWAMMLAGFAGLGFLGYRRKAANFAA